MPRTSEPVPTSTEHNEHDHALDSDRRRSLDRMIEIAEESGMYELTATPKRTP